MIYDLILDVVLAYIIDLFCGDPAWLPHPVRFIGWLIQRTEKRLRQIVNWWANKAVQRSAAFDSAQAERLAGIILTVIVVALTFFLVYAIILIASWFHPVLFHMLNIYFIYSALATKCLAIEAKKVYTALIQNDIRAARKKLAGLVGRETEQLEPEEVIRGAVETTAENTVDGVVSPLVYALFGSLFGLGAPLVYAFKAISTLDSMVGYMNEPYLNFGRFSAKLDDAANYLPARLTAVLIAVSTLFCGNNFLRSLKIMWRDRRNHKSPNCAYPEAAVAGALGVRIGGTNIYCGTVEEKPVIGDPTKPLAAADIHATIRLMYVTSLLALFIGVGAILLFTAWFTRFFVTLPH
jgi:adenosylcobinamide-phosphate synthase